jgi:hypothetical protein
MVGIILKFCIQNEDNYQPFYHRISTHQQHLLTAAQTTSCNNLKSVLTYHASDLVRLPLWQCVYLESQRAFRQHWQFQANNHCQWKSYWTKSQQSTIQHNNAITKPLLQTVEKMHMRTLSTFTRFIGFDVHHALLVQSAAQPRDRA